MSLFSTGLRIEELRPRPVLVFEHGNLCLPLPPLDHLNIGAHALLGVPLHKLMEREPVRVEAREGDELPDVAEPSELTGGAWSSKWTPAAPASMNIFISRMTAVSPP